MFRKTLAFGFAIATLISAAGCSTLADARAARGTGLSRVYAAPTETVWKAVPPVLKEVGLDMVADNKAERYILAQRGMSALSYGENIAIFIDAAGGATSTKVEVVSKKSFSPNILAPNWEKDILDKLDAKLKSPN